MPPAPPLNPRPRRIAMDLAERTVLITGANRGIGLVLTNALLDRGVRKIYAGVRDLNKLPDFGDDRVEPIELDITDSEQIRRAAAAAPDVNLLINNAGVAAFASILDGPRELVERVSR